MIDMSRITTNWSIAYSSATDQFTVTYASTYAALVVDADHLAPTASSSDANLIYVNDIEQTNLDWRKCTSPLAASRTALITAIQALDTGAAAEIHPTSVTNYEVTGTLTVGVVTGASSVSTTDATVTGTLTADTVDGLDTVTLVDRSAAASDPSSGQSVVWVSQGTTLEGDGDLMVKHNNGSTVERSLVAARVPYLQDVHLASEGDLSYSGSSSTATNMCQLTLGPGTWFLSGVAPLVGITGGSVLSFFSTVSGTSVTAISEAGEQLNSVNNNRFTMVVQDVVSPTTSTTYYFNFRPFSNSSGLAVDVSLDMTPTFTAFRLQ